MRNKKIMMVRTGVLLSTLAFGTSLVAQTVIQGSSPNNPLPSLRDIAASPRLYRGATREEHRVKSIPLPPGFRGLADEIVQTEAKTPSAFVDANSFEGIGGGLIINGRPFSVGASPADTTGAIGSRHYVQWVNTSFAIFDREGALVYGPTSGKTLWKGFKGPCETDNDGDPVVMYDRFAQRWILTQFAVSSGPPFYECIAVSNTDDPTGGYARYAFAFSDFNDYPKFGVWNDAYYATYNMFKEDDFAGSQICAYEREKMLRGETAKTQCFAVTAGGLLPSDAETLPAPGTPQFVLGFGVSKLNIWKISVNWADANKTTLNGPTAVKVDPFIPACGQGPCIRQPGTTTQLDGLGDRLMSRIPYRRRNTIDTLILNHSVFVSGYGGDSSTGIRWYELHNPNGVPTVAQSGTYAPDETARWMGTVGMDKQGNIALGYSASGKTVRPSIRITGKTSDDPASLLRKELVLIDGAGSQELDRWGDYSTMSLDPRDDCTFWLTTQYQAKDGSYNWHTRVAQVRFESCR
jgi:hypothetical protein